MESAMSDFSNRDIERLYDKYNPNAVRTGDIVMVSLGQVKYQARVVGLDLDIKNKKVFANLKLSEQNKRNPIRVDVSDCQKRTLPLYPGHHNGG
tara:strand:+ start:1462 stop:1743 length:282 start_codon:yes stop_codon:yes gene_type:complete